MPQENDTEHGISSGSAPFANVKSSQKEIHYILVFVTLEPSRYTMDHPDFIA